MPRSTDPQVWELVTILRECRNAARRRRSACAETGHPWFRYYNAIATDLDQLLFELGGIAYR